jgi:hypothetical protein
MRLPLAALILALSVALVGGCGGDDDDSATTTEGSAAATAEPGSQSGTGEGPGEGRTNAAQKDGDGDGGSAAAGGSGGSSESEEEVLERAEEEFRPQTGADNSIQEFGEEQTGEVKSAVTEAMFAFFRAMASSDYAAICSGLTSANVEQLETFLKLKDKPGNCETVLEEILVAPSSEARKAANGVVYQVREEDGNAFVLFVPEGGVASYFVMKDEDGAWKATSVTTGTPLRPGETIPAQ